MGIDNLQPRATHSPDDSLQRSLTVPNEPPAAQVLKGHTENHVALTLGRMKNPEVRNQYVRLAHESDAAAGRPQRSDEDISLDLDERIKLLEQNPTVIPDPNEWAEKRQLVPLDPKWNGFKVTSGKAPSEAQMRIFRAHDQGHILRDDFPKDYFAGAFDASKMIFTPEGYNEWKKIDGMPDIPFERYETSMRTYLSLSVEIAERMAQLKNFFGMKGNDPFTKEHLDLARANYVTVTGVDNDMRHFFQAITPETEEKFIELINNSGI